MLKKKFVPIALCSLMLASPMVIAEEAHHPAQEGVAAGENVPADTAAVVSEAAPAGSGGMMMGDSGVMGEQPPEGSPPAGSMGPGMMMGRPGMMGGPGGGMMSKRMMSGGMGRGGGMGMMGSMQGNDDGRGGMMGMMHGGKGGGMMGGGHGGGQGHGMRGTHREVIGRLDLLEARMAKIETMLERLLER